MILLTFWSWILNNVKGIYRCMRGCLHAVCTFVFVCVCMSETTRWAICHQELDCKDTFSHAQEPYTQNHYWWLMNLFFHSRCLHRVFHHVYVSLLTPVEWMKPLLHTMSRGMRNHIKQIVRKPAKWLKHHVQAICTCRKSKVTTSR